MRLGTAIECLVDNYKYASDKEWINDKVAWALYHTWKEADRKTNSSEIPNNCDTCRWGEWYKQGYDVTMMSDECGGCCSWNNKWTPLYKCLDIKKIIKSLPTRKFEDEPQTERSE